MSRKTLEMFFLVAILLVAPILMGASFQEQRQCVNPFMYPSLFFYFKGLNDQPVSKTITWNNKVVLGSETYSNEEIILNGNLTVGLGGSLTLINVDLKVNCVANGSNRIRVLNGGALYIRDADGNPKTVYDASIITSNNPNYRFTFKVERGATFQMKNSELSYCGYGGKYYDRGLFINTTGAIIEGNTFKNNQRGIIIWNFASHSIVRNNNAINNSGHGFYLYTHYQYVSTTGDITLTGNTAENNGGSGFYIYETKDNDISGNTAINNSHGFYMGYVCVNNKLNGNTAIGNRGHGFYVQAGYSNNFTDNTAISNSGDGFMLFDSENNRLEGNTAINNEGNGFSLFIEANKNNLKSNTAINNKVYGFFLSGSDNNVLHNNEVINSTNKAYYVGGCSGTDLTGSVVSNYLRIRAVDRSGSSLSGADVKVAVNGNSVYASEGYGGVDPKTNAEGLTDWIPVPYQFYSGLTPHNNVVEVWVSGCGHKEVDMSTSHTETFTEKANILPLVFFAAAQDLQGVPTVLVIGGLVGVALVGSALALLILRRRA